MTRDLLLRLLSFQGFFLLPLLSSRIRKIKSPRRAIFCNSFIGQFNLSETIVLPFVFPEYKGSSFGGFVEEINYIYLLFNYIHHTV